MNNLCYVMRYVKVLRMYKGLKWFRNIGTTARVYYHPGCIEDLIISYRLMLHRFSAKGKLSSRHRRSSIMFPSPNYLLLVFSVISLSTSVAVALRGPCSVDAAVTWVGNNKMYLFKGDKYVRWEEEDGKGLGDIQPLSAWAGIPTNLDAATTWRSYNYFFKGCQYWRYDKHSKTTGPSPISAWKLPCDLDAAVMWEDNTYFFKGNRYWKWNSEKYLGEMPLSNWEGVDSSIDAGVKWAKNGKTYLLREEYYWRFGKDDNSKHLVNDGWDKLLDSDLLPNCPCVCKGISNKNWDFKAIKYKLDVASIIAETPVAMGSQRVDNKGGSATPSITFVVSKTVTETESVTNTVGASISVAAEFSFGVPLIAEGSITTTVTASYEHTWGSEKSVAKAMSASYECPAKAGTLVTCTSTLSMNRLNVPFTMTVQHKTKGCICNVEGVYNKVAVASMLLTVKED